MLEMSLSMSSETVVTALGIYRQKYSKRANY